MAWLSGQGLVSARLARQLRHSPPEPGGARQLRMARQGDLGRAGLGRRGTAAWVPQGLAGPGSAVRSWPRKAVQGLDSPAVVARLGHSGFGLAPQLSLGAVQRGRARRAWCGSAGMALPPEGMTTGRQGMSDLWHEASASHDLEAREAASARADAEMLPILSFLFQSATPRE